MLAKHLRSDFYYLPSKDMRHLIPISGKDSLATAIVMQKLGKDIDFEYFFNDTGTELPETYEWLNKVERKLGIRIKRIGKSLEDIIEDQGYLPSHTSRFCTRMAKINPMIDYIGGEEANIYLGIRADEPAREGFNNKRSDNIEPIYPLKKQGIGINEVYSIITSHDLAPPEFRWEEIEQRSIKILGPLAKRLDRLHPWQRARLFSWRSRTNCYHCFYQARYEWVGLLSFHPNLFKKAKEMEERIGSQGDRKSSFFWIKGYPLSLLEQPEEIERIKRKRIAKIVLAVAPERRKSKGRLIYDKAQDQSFDDRMKMELQEIDSIRSCGIFCGK